MDAYVPIILGLISMVTTISAAVIAANAKKTTENQHKSDRILENLEKRVKNTEIVQATQEVQIQNIKEDVKRLQVA